MQTALITLIKGYQYLISPFIGPTCRFYPSCSAYAEEALKSHGVARGLWLSTKRLARCHPFSAGGVDPVPATTKKDNPFKCEHC